MSYHLTWCPRPYFDVVPFASHPTPSLVAPLPSHQSAPPQHHHLRLWHVLQCRPLLTYGVGVPLRSANHLMWSSLSLQHLHPYLLHHPIHNWRLLNHAQGHNNGHHPRLLVLVNLRNFPVCQMLLSNLLQFYFRFLTYDRAKHNRRYIIASFTYFLWNTPTSNYLPLV